MSAKTATKKEAPPQHELDRTDAIGSKAKRENYRWWTLAKRRAEAKVREWSGGGEDLNGRLDFWKGELQRAEEQLVIAKELVLHAWD